MSSKFAECEAKKRYDREAFDSLSSVASLERLYHVNFTYIRSKILGGNDKHQFRFNGGEKIKFVGHYTGDSFAPSTRAIQIKPVDGEQFSVETFYKREPSHKMNHFIKTSKRHVESIRKLCELFVNIFDSNIFDSGEAEILYEKYDAVFNMEKCDFPDYKGAKKIVFYDGFIGDGKTTYISETGNFDSECCGFWRLPLKPEEPEASSSRMPERFIPMFTFIGMFIAVREAFRNNLETIIIDRSWISQMWFNRVDPDMNEEFYMKAIFYIYAGLMDFSTFEMNKFKFPDIYIMYPERVTNIWPFGACRLLEREVYPTQDVYNEVSRAFVEFFNGELDNLLTPASPPPKDNKRKLPDYYMSHFDDKN